MSYLTDAVTEIGTGAGKGAAFLHVQETDVVEPRTLLDAGEYAERFYKKDRGYNGPLHTVVQEVEDGWQVMVMVDGT